MIRLPNALRSRREFDRLVEGALGAALALDGDRQPLLRQLLHQHREAAILRAEQAVGGQLHLVEEQFRRVVAVKPDLVEVAAAAEAFVAGLDQEQRNALGAAFLGGAGGDDDQVGRLAVGDVGLGSADSFQPLPSGLGDGLDALQVAARAGLGHGDGADRRPGDHAGQVALLLLLAAVMDDDNRRRCPTAA